MPSNAILYRMAQGVPGDVSRPSVATIESQPYGATAFGIYGQAVQLASGLAIPVNATGLFVYGFLVRPFPTTGVNASDPLGTSVPPTSGVASIMRRGYMTVYCQLGTPAPGATVYIRFQAAAGQQILGGVEAGTTANNYAMNAATTGIAQFMSAADANGMVEIGFNI